MTTIHKYIYKILPSYLKEQYRIDLFEGNYVLNTPLFIFKKQWEKLKLNKKIKKCEVYTLKDKKEQNCNCYYYLPCSLMQIEKETRKDFFEENQSLTFGCEIGY